jgi:anti-anti-sigma factor
VDLTQLGFMTSVGAGLLLEVAERAEGRGGLDVLLPATGEARRMLDLTGLTSALVPERDPNGLPR